MTFAERVPVADGESQASLLLRQLRDHRERIDVLLDRTSAVLKARGALDAIAIGRIRWQLTRTLREYQIFKHERLFRHLIAQGGATAVKAEVLKQNCLKAGDAFRAHVLEWSAGAILDRPEDYRSATLAQIQNVRAHLVGESHAVTMLLRG